MYKLNFINFAVDLPALNRFRIGDYVVADACAKFDKHEGEVIGIAMTSTIGRQLQENITLLCDGTMSDGWKANDLRKVMRPTPIGSPQQGPPYYTWPRLKKSIWDILDTAQLSSKHYFDDGALLVMLSDKIYQNVKPALDEAEAESVSLKSYKDELIRLAALVGEEADPFAAWEHIGPIIDSHKAVQNQLTDDRERFETAVIERLKESGFLEVEIRTECLARCGDGYIDGHINSAWHYWKRGQQGRTT